MTPLEPTTITTKLRFTRFSKGLQGFSACTIKTEKGNASSESGALKKIQEIKEKSGKMDFGKLAAQYIEDVDSKENKGDLGTFGRGRMVPEFETVAFAQAVGQARAAAQCQTQRPEVCGQPPPCIQPQTRDAS
ncbi:MAG: hypothetical protein C5B49_12255 [Bdellovibrio sp.]|nr:MAG: hypothetical protein C5B49_12255 [Bdellovibrio sp.]